MHLWPCCLLLGKDWSSVQSRPRAAEQLVDGSEGAAITTADLAEHFTLRQNLGVTNIG